QGHETTGSLYNTGTGLHIQIEGVQKAVFYIRSLTCYILFILLTKVTFKPGHPSLPRRLQIKTNKLVAFSTTPDLCLYTNTSKYNYLNYIILALHPTISHHKTRAKMPTPFIRPYNPTLDFANGLHVYFATIDPSLDFEPARTIGSYLWYRPYVHLTPETCHVLDDGSGHIVGYCIGAADTLAFAQRWREEFLAEIDAACVPRPEVRTGNVGMEGEMVRGFRAAAYAAHVSMLQDWPEVLGRFPAHLHIDILPGFQKKGYGRQLVEAFFGTVKGIGAQGVHLDMVRTNVNALAFYERVGFRRCEQVLDGGASGEAGVDGVVLTLVREL
ncbi:hypothetical protein IAQ61_006369, partial [Plenodomus lingam]